MSRTSRSIRRRCLALAAIAAGVNWLATGQAIAVDGGADSPLGSALDNTLRNPAGGAAGNPVSSVLDSVRQADHVGLPGLSSADGVLSIADRAGSGAGHGLRSLPGLTKPEAADKAASEGAAAADSPPKVPGLRDVTRLATAPDQPGLAELRGIPGRVIRGDVPDTASAVAPEAGELAEKAGDLTADIPKAPDLPPASVIEAPALPGAVPPLSHPGDGHSRH